MQENNGGRRVLTVRADGRDLARTTRQLRADMARLRLQGYEVRCWQVKAFLTKGGNGDTAWLVAKR